MLNYIEYLNQYFNIPIVAITIFIIVYLAINVIGEILEFKGKIVPEFVKIRKYFARKKIEREVIQKMPKMMDDVKALFNDFGQHYSSDNIMMRDKWMREVNESMWEFQNIKNIVLDIQIDNKRNAIIAFANRAIDMNILISKEEYERIFALHDEYDKIIKENGLTNGQVDVAYNMIKKSYEERMIVHAFIEYKNDYETI